MKPYVLVIRAVGSEFLLQLLRPIAIVVVITVTILAAAAAWLTTMNAWYWLLEAIVLILLLLVLTACAALLFTIRVLRPAMTAEQRLAVRNFTGKLQQVADDVRTPWPWIIIKVLLDIFHPSANGYLTRLAGSSKTLYPDMRDLQAMFTERR